MTNQEKALLMHARATTREPDADLTPGFGLELNYMGTKRKLAPQIADIVCDAQEGIALDLFSGMCAIGSAISTRRVVWNNDVQRFAAGVAAALFTSPDQPPRAQVVADSLHDDFLHNLSALQLRYRQRVNAEKRALGARQLNGLKQYLNCYAHAHTSSATTREVSRLRQSPHAFPNRLFSLLYADSYFGLSQCMEIDSIVYSIQQSATKAPYLSPSQRLWLLLSLGRALQKIATTTGHFAQYLTPKASTFSRYIGQREKYVWDTWLYSIPNEGPIGQPEWRKTNMAFNQDSLQLLRLLAKRKVKPSVVYADPPYTDDQYSRYYHILETLIRYDYPEVIGKGRYRKDRFLTPFSHKTHAVAAFEEMAARTSALRADIVVSYPANGLLNQLGVDPTTLLAKHFRKVQECLRTTHSHSTLGASKGAASEQVTEVVYRGTL
jgi:adenine-specific DNA-methyltransferase